MRIRKVSQPSALPLDTAQVVDSYSTSTTDAYSCSYINELGCYGTYSTSEVRIGTWMNKPLYRKCYSVSSFPNNANSWVATGINNIDEVIYCGGFETNGNERVFLSSAYSSSNFDCLVYDHVFTGHNNSIRIHTTSNRSSYSGYVWIEYTKTTD